MRKILIWDLPTRLFHWLLVACVAGAWISAESEAFDWHLRFGYTVLALVLFRLIWGLIGSETARFANFIRGPKDIRHHIQELRAPGRMQAHPGHNPLGALAVVGLLSLVSVQVTTGLFTSDDIMTDGPLVKYVASSTVSLMRAIHVNGFNVLLAVVALHVVAVLAYALLKRLDLVRPMVTGKANLNDEVPAPRMVPLVRGLLVAGLCAGLVWIFVEYV